MELKANEEIDYLLAKKKKVKKVLFIAIPLILLGVLGLWRISQNPKQQHNTTQQESNNTASAAEWPALWGAPDNRNICQNNKVSKYTALPMGLEDIKFVQPIGELRESHIVPGDHAGIDYKTSPNSTPVRVFAPADGFLVRVEKHPYDPPQGYPKMNHYHVYLEHSCTFFTGFVHITEFARDILQKSSELKSLDEKRASEFENILLRIPVKAGQKIGKAWSFGLLGIVTVDLSHTNKGYLKPESYRKGENWRVHSVSPFDYFEEPLKGQIMTKNPRTAEPRGGKIDFDIEGRLIGNWFLEGTPGLKGIEGPPRQCGNWPCPYWEGHLALVYDYIDPTQLRVSVGYSAGLSGRTPFGVKGNSPDFKDIGVENGLVKYELVSLRDLSKEKGYDTETPLITVNDDSQILGTMLVQVVDKDSIKVEIFPGKSKDQVSAFTSNARVYRR